MQPWKRVEPTKTQKVGWRTIVTKVFEKPDGSVATFDLTGPEHQHHAGVIALTKDGRVITARQFRPGPEKIMHEIPGGTVDEGETPEEAVRRELREETGYVPGSLTYLGPHHKDAYMCATWHYFLAADCVRETDQALDEHEMIDIVTMPIHEYIACALHDGMSDIAAVFMAYEQLQKLKEEA